MSHIKLAALVRGCDVQFFIASVAALKRAGVLSGTLVALMQSQDDQGFLLQRASGLAGEVGAAGAVNAWMACAANGPA